MKTGALILLVLLSGLFTVRANDNSAALEKLRKIPPAPANAFSLDLPKKLTVLVVKGQGVFINDSKTAVPFNQVLEALAALPKEAWPYGRVITYYPSPPGQRLVGDTDPLPADVKKVETELKAAGIELIRGMSP